MKECLNITSRSKDWRAAILSNLAHTPFRIGDHVFQCVEAPLQGIKFEDPEMREQVFRMDGISALRAGRPITEAIALRETSYVYWQGDRIVYNSVGHRLLIATFIGEKVRQNPEVQRALLATSGTFICHDPGKPENPNTSLPEKFYMEILLAQRGLLERLISIGSLPKA